LKMNHSCLCHISYTKIYYNF